MSDNTDIDQPKPRVDSQYENSNIAPVENKNEQQLEGNVEQQIGNNVQQGVGNYEQQQQQLPSPSPPPQNSPQNFQIDENTMVFVPSNSTAVPPKSDDDIGNILKYTFIATGTLFFIVISITLSILIAKKLKERNKDNQMQAYKNDSAQERSTSKSSNVNNSKSYMNSIDHIKYRNLNIPDDSLNDIDIYSPSINGFSNFSLSQTAVNSNGNGMNGSLLSPQVYDSLLYDSKMGNPAYYNANSNSNIDNKFAFKEGSYGNTAYEMNQNQNFYFNKKDPLFDDFIDGSL